MKQIIISIFVVLLIIAGCKNDSNPFSTSTEPALVVDTLKIGAIVNTDTSADSPGTYFSLRLAYHFAGKPGSLGEISLSTPTIGFTISISYNAPTPIGVQLSYGDQVKDTNTFPDQDSVLVHVYFVGQFWERNGTSIIDYGSFSIRDSMWVELRR